MECIAVVGDSSSVGFGTKGRSYPVVLAERLGVERLHVNAAFGKTTRMALAEDMAPTLALAPDMIIIQTGMADSLLHPGQHLQRFIERVAPAEWHGVDGLERRAVFADSRRLRVKQAATAALKTGVKRSLVAMTGGYTRMQPHAYADCLDRLLSGLEASGAIVVSIGIYQTDEHFFPRQRRTATPFVEARRDVLLRHPEVVCVEPDEVLARWEDYLDDHGHWNAAGHERVAALTVSSLHDAGVMAGPVQEITAPS